MSDYNAMNYAVVKPLRRIGNALGRREPIHFLHIGKNAGTQIKHVLDHANKVSKKYRFIMHRHKVHLTDIPEHAHYFFSIRDPVSRFRSAFYSRKRKGMPRTWVDWSASEAIAFRDFEHANDLAESLFEDGIQGVKAYCAMRSLIHTSMNQFSWFGRSGHFLELCPPLDIVRQEHFNEDMQRLMRKIDLDAEIVTTADPVKSHRNDYTGTPALSDKAVGNIKRWYAVDFEFYRVCENWIANHEATGPILY